MTTEVTATLGEVSDTELFSGAMETPATEPTPVIPETVVTEQPTGEQPRDEHGRFSSKQAETTDAAPTQPQPVETTPNQTQDEAHVPSWRLREVREAREAAERRAAEAERRATEFQNQLRQFTEKPKEVPDVLTDPDAFRGHLEQTFDKRIRTMEANFSFRLAHREHGGMFEKAYTEATGMADRGDTSVIKQIMASSDPGAALVTWYKRDQALKEFGDDPESYKKKLREELLKDEGFRTEVVNAIKGNGAVQPNGAARQPATVVQLPPSLNKVTSAAADALPDNDMSDPGLFAYATRR